MALIAFPSEKEDDQSQLSQACHIVCLPNGRKENITRRFLTLNYSVPPQAIVYWCSYSLPQSRTDNPDTSHI